MQSLLGGLQRRQECGQPACVMPFLRLRSGSRPCAKRLHIPCVSLVSEQQLPSLFSCADLFLIVLKHTQRSLASSTGRASYPSPKSTPTRLSGTQAKPVRMRSPGLRPKSQGDPRPHLPLTPDFRAIPWTRKSGTWGEVEPQNSPECLEQTFLLLACTLRLTQLSQEPDIL